MTREKAPFNLPGNATDISYARAPDGKRDLYEFTTDEADFRAWTSEIETNCINSRMESVQGFARMERYCSLVPHRPRPKLSSIWQDWEFHWTLEGRESRAVFDRTYQRVYVESRRR